MHHPQLLGTPLQHRDTVTLLQLCAAVQGGGELLAARGVLLQDSFQASHSVRLKVGGFGAHIPLEEWGRVAAAFPTRVGGFEEAFTEEQNAATVEGEVAKRRHMTL